MRAGATRSAWTGEAFGNATQACHVHVHVHDPEPAVLLSVVSWLVGRLDGNLREKQELTQYAVR
jgi:hypothetical protein